MRVTAVPALHGSPEIGVVNGPVDRVRAGGGRLAEVYVSGDNASLDVVAVVAEQFPAIEIAILNLGAAQIAARGEAFLTLTAELAARAATVLGVRAVIPVHQDGWGHYTQGADDVVRAFEAAGLTDVLVDLRPGDSATVWPRPADISLHLGEKWFPLLDDVRGQFDSNTVADVAGLVVHTVRDRERVAGIAHNGWLPLQPIFERSLQNTDDFLAGVEMLERWRIRGELHPRLNDLSPGDAEVVPLQIDPPQPWC